MTSVMRKILELRRAAQLRNQRPLTIEIGELQARRLADELNERGSITLLVGGTEETRPLTWHDIVHPDSRLYGMSFVGAEWSEYLSVRSEGQSVLPEEHRLKPEAWR